MPHCARQPHYDRPMGSCQGLHLYLRQLRPRGAPPLGQTDPERHRTKQDTTPIPKLSNPTTNQCVRLRLQPDRPSTHPSTASTHEGIKLFQETKSPQPLMHIDRPTFQPLDEACYHCPPMALTQKGLLLGRQAHPEHHHNIITI